MQVCSASRKIHPLHPEIATCAVVALLSTNWQQDSTRMQAAAGSSLLQWHCSDGSGDVGVLNYSHN
jgi:hypothetical protein